MAGRTLGTMGAATGSVLTLMIFGWDTGVTARPRPPTGASEVVIWLMASLEQAATQCSHSRQSAPSTTATSSIR